MPEKPVPQYKGIFVLGPVDGREEKQKKACSDSHRSSSSSNTRTSSNSKWIWAAPASSLSAPVKDRRRITDVIRDLILFPRWWTASISPEETYLVVDDRDAAKLISLQVANNKAGQLAECVTARQNRVSEGGWQTHCTAMTFTITEQNQVVNWNLKSTSYHCKYVTKTL